MNARPGENVFRAVHRLAAEERLRRHKIGCAVCSHPYTEKYCIYRDRLEQQAKERK
jgi:hypothetical protein